MSVFVRVWSTFFPCVFLSAKGGDRDCRLVSRCVPYPARYTRTSGGRTPRMPSIDIHPWGQCSEALLSCRFSVVLDVSRVRECWSVCLPVCLSVRLSGCLSVGGIGHWSVVWPRGVAWRGVACRSSQDRSGEVSLARKRVTFFVCRRRPAVDRLYVCVCQYTACLCICVE